MPLSTEQKQAIVNALIAGNGDGCCGWVEEDREVLNAFPDEKLLAMDTVRAQMTANATRVRELEPVVNAVRTAARKPRMALNEMPEFIKEKIEAKEEGEEEEEEEEEVKNKRKPAANALTRERVLAALSPEDREDLEFARNEKARQKRELVDRITANIADPQQRQQQAERLMKRGLEELSADLSLLPAREEPRPVSYIGTTGFPTNAAPRKREPLADPQSYAAG